MNSGMNLTITLDDVPVVQNNLYKVAKMAAISMTNVFLDAAEDIQNAAKVILEQRSTERTGKKYWTGKLQKEISIRSGGGTTQVIDPSIGGQYRNISTGRIAGFTPDNISVIVGVDSTEIDYAEWVEFGHKVKSKTNNWWEGYHYLQGAWLAVSPTIETKMKTHIWLDLEKYATTIKTGNKTLVRRNSTTGKIVGAF